MLLIDVTVFAPVVNHLTDIAISSLPLLTVVIKRLIARKKEKLEKDVETRSDEKLPDEALCSNEACNESSTGDPVLASVHLSEVQFDNTIDEKLSHRFFLSTLTHSDSALRKGIPNVPDTIEKQALADLAVNVLDEIKGKFPTMHITSGYRNEHVNRLAGGKPNSQHMKGEAADFTVPGRSLKEVYRWILASDIDYDQMIIEHGRWIHISYTKRRNNRNESFAVR